jgi:hypothetical protein
LNLKDGGQFLYYQATPLVLAKDGGQFFYYQVTPLVLATDGGQFLYYQATPFVLAPYLFWQNSCVHSLYLV